MDFVISLIPFLLIFVVFSLTSKRNFSKLQKTYKKEIIPSFEKLNIKVPEPKKDILGDPRISFTANYKELKIRIGYYLEHIYKSDSKPTTTFKIKIPETRIRKLVIYRKGILSRYILRSRLKIKGNERDKLQIYNHFKDEKELREGQEFGEEIFTPNIIQKLISLTPGTSLFLESSLITIKSPKYVSDYEEIKTIFDIFYELSGKNWEKFSPNEDSENKFVKDSLNSIIKAFSTYDFSLVENIDEKFRSEMIKFFTPPSEIPIQMPHNLEIEKTEKDKYIIYKCTGNYEIEDEVTNKVTLFFNKEKNLFTFWQDDIWGEKWGEK